MIPELLSRSIDIDVDLDDAWRAMIDPPRWNPGFVYATVTVLDGEKDSVGEVTHVEFGDGAGNIVDDLYAKIVRLEDRAHITWFCIPTTAPEEYHNFLDFELVPRGDGVTFRIHLYIQSELAAEAFVAYREEHEQLLVTLTTALKEHLERDLPFTSRLSASSPPLIGSM